MKLAKQDLENIESLRLETRDKKIYVRYTIIIMWDKNFSYLQIATALGVGIKTVQRAIKVYTSEGVEQLAIYKYTGRSSSLTENQIKLLEMELTENLYVKVGEVKRWIQKQFGVTMSISAITKLLKKMGFVYKKAKVQPGKADSSVQRKAAKAIQTLVSRKNKDSKVVFIDGTHPVYNTEPCYGWIKKGKEYPIPSNTGRKRLNINGAVDAEDPTDVYVDYTDSVNAQSTIRLLEQIEKKNPDKKRIYIFSDNAMYYKSKIIKAWLKLHPKFKWRYLPPYSPNLNLIERLWGFMKRETIKGYYYETFEEFKNAIATFFKDIKSQKEKLATLMTLKFQIISWD